MENSASKTCHDMEGSLSKISNSTEQIDIQIDEEIVRIIGSLDFGGNDVHASVHNSDVNTVDSERSVNTTNQLPTTQKTSGKYAIRESANSSRTKIGTGSLSDWRTNCSWSKTDHDIKGISVLAAKEATEFISYLSKQTGIKLNEVNSEEDHNISESKCFALNVCAGSSSGLGMINDYHESSTKTDHVIEDEDTETPLSCNDPIFIRPREQSQIGTMNLWQNRSAGLLIDASPFSNLQYIESHGESQFWGFQETSRNYNMMARANTLFSQFHGNFLDMMVDRERSSLFEELLDECNDEQLNIIIKEIMWDPKWFLSAASSKVGATSMLKLIRRIEKTNHAYTLTGLLSTMLYDLITHYKARTVINQCLHHFGSKPNEVLYEQVIVYHQSLATHDVGCISLNKCIDTISGTQRMRLLNNIAEGAVFLSNDPYGNYVVQHVMNLRHALFTTKILSCLQGHFARLSHTKEGSHVVESCINSSELGTHVVVEEFLQTPLTPFNLARHRFGNYVIQTALGNLKIQRNITLYFSLVKALEPYCSELKRSPGGKQVINLIKYDIGINH